MRFLKTIFVLLLMWTAAASLACSALAQGTGNSSTISGTVTDPSGAVVPGASVEISNAVSGYSREATTDSSGSFSLSNIPYNPYHMTVTSKNFAAYVQDVDVRSAVPIALKISLQLAGVNATVTVQAGADLI